MPMKLTAARLARLETLREHYRATLFEDVVPWWEQHSLDPECGGYYSCLDREGKPWSTDKFMWMTGREIWTFSHLHNRYRRNQAWVDAARLGADFILKHAFQPEGKMYFRLSREGKPMAKCLSLFSEMFCAMGLGELSKATGDAGLWAKARGCTISWCPGSACLRTRPCWAIPWRPSSTFIPTTCAGS